MQNKRLFRYGLVGTLIVALCCFTPILVILFAILGIGWAVGYVDYVLLPVLFLLLGITIYAFWRMQVQATETAVPGSEPVDER